eukprot:3151613-Pyramimonas_sp.AAC.1
MAAGIAHHGAAFGFYVPSCFSHGATYGRFIGNHDGLTSLAAWYGANYSAPDAADAAVAYQLMDAYGRGPTPQCNPSCNGMCTCSADSLANCPGGCGDPAAGVILGFGQGGDLDPSKDQLVENLVVQKNCSTPGPETCNADAARAFNASCGEAFQVRSEREASANRVMSANRVSPTPKGPVRDRLSTAPA